jgi:L,D-transpeptidase catalytic domain
MRFLTNLLTKVTLSSMILTAPAMINGNTKYSNSSIPLSEKEDSKPFYSSAVIRKFIDRPLVVGIRAVAIPGSASRSEITAVADAIMPAPVTTVNTASASAIAVIPVIKAVTEAKAPAVVNATAPVRMAAVVNTAMAAKISAPKFVTFSSAATMATARAAELRLVINQASLIYSSMNLEDAGLGEKAFEYAWRGYHNLLKKGMIQKRSVLSICDFSQSSRTKRMYVIDVQHRKLLYRTYVAHGQNSGDEYATTFSNEPDSYKSSLGFYLTQRTYMGHNGLSLKLNGVDSGFNDMALKRQIVLHGSAYVSDRYMQDYGTLGTSLGCPALPAAVSGKIIRAVKDGSVLFIYHPSQQYLSHSQVINNYM